jgi:hypothetical protein
MEDDMEKKSFKQAITDAVAPSDTRRQTSSNILCSHRSSHIKLTTPAVHKALDVAIIAANSAFAAKAAIGGTASGATLVWIPLMIAP